MADIREKQLQRREGLCQLIGSKLLADTKVTLLPWTSGEVKPHGRERMVREGTIFIVTGKPKDREWPRTKCLSVSNQSLLSPHFSTMPSYYESIKGSLH